MRNEWAKRVRAARKAAGWTQAQLAEASGSSQMTVSNVENGVGCSDDMKVRIAAALGEHPGDLFPLLPEPDKATA